MARLTWEWLHAISVPLHSDSSPTYAKIYLTTPIKHRFTNIWILCKLAGIFDRFVVFRSDYLTSWLWWVSMHGFHKSKTFEDIWMDSTLMTLRVWFMLDQICRKVHTFWFLILLMFPIFCQTCFMIDSQSNHNKSSTTFDWFDLEF